MIRRRFSGVNLPPRRVRTTPPSAFCVVFAEPDPAGVRYTVGPYCTAGGCVMQVRLLGPVDVMVDGDPRPVRGLRRKAVLAVLALRGGEIVSTDQLADAVWGHDAPSTAVNTLQSHMSYLRTVLGTRARSWPGPPVTCWTCPTTAPMCGKQSGCCARPRSRQNRPRWRGACTGR